MHYKNIHVRDLAWALNSPSLMSFGSKKSPIWSNNSWSLQEYEKSKKLLTTCDNDPSELTEAVKPWPRFRLGKYYESLWSFWLKKNPRYELLYENLQLHKNGITLGEFDFILRDLKTKKTAHWEVSVKFYLGYGDTSLPSSWYGLQFNDRLDKKADHLNQQQCQLSKSYEGKLFLSQKNIHVDEVRVILKGRLFYPSTTGNNQIPQNSNPQHLKSEWKTFSDFITNHQQQPYQWVILNKSQWFSNRDLNDPHYEFDDLKKLIADQIHSNPFCLAALNEGRETFRLFVVPDGWHLPA